MKRERRQDGIELNFDGLADAVTNLVGTLILLVVLVVGLTRDAALPHEEQPHETTKAPALPKSNQVRDVVFRPPLEHVTDKLPLFLVCENERLSIIGDNEQIARGVQQASAQKGATVSLPSGDFDLQRPSVGRVKAVRRLGALGETAAELGKPNSKLRRFLRTHPASEFHIQFNIAPDSFAMFHRARQLVWKSNYEVGWQFLLAGQSVTFGAGGGRSRVQ